MYRRKRYVRPRKKRIYLKPRRKRIRRIGRIRRRIIIRRGVSHPYVDKRERLMLGSGSSKTIGKQKGGFFLIGPALAAAPPIIDLLSKVIR